MSNKKPFSKGQSLAEKMAQTLKGKPADTPQSTDKAGLATPSASGSAQVTSAINILAGQQANTDTSVILIDLDLIDVEAQIRQEFDQNYIEDLASDFAANPTKQPNQPVTVWKREGGRYLLDDGENRFRAMHFAKSHRKELGIEDITAFTTIRATVRTDEPNKLDRIQSQCKANLLRDDLSPVEIANAAQLYLEENSSGTHAEIAKWLGFQKLSSGRVKVSNSLKLVNKCDADLVESVRVGEISMGTAFEVQDARRREQSAAFKNSDGKATNGEGSKAKAKLDKAKSGKKSVKVSIDLEALKTAAQIIKIIAVQHETETELFDKLERKDIVKIFKEENLLKILGSAE